MGCLSVLFAAAFPRLGLFIVWLLRPVQVDAAFDTKVWPILGFIFLPLTTLMYVVIQAPGVSLGGWEWFWLGVAAMLDIGHVGFAAFQGRGVSNTGLAPLPGAPGSAS